MESKRFKVIIAGGSVSGLALASMLEHAGIDFVVLEKYSKVAPSNGAGIAVLPNGARILDQIGCYDNFMSQVEMNEVFENQIMERDGSQVFGVKKYNTHVKKRYGYSMVFVDRPLLLKSLYDNIRDKSKVLVNKGVEHVEHVPGGVRVTTKDGDVFTGSVLVGADGVHSTVRKEMWRLADAEKPGYFPEKDRTDARSNYACLYGIAKETPGVPMDAFLFTHGKGYTHLISVVPGPRIAWALPVKLPKTINGLYDNIPRYTQADRDAMAAELFDTKVCGDVPFKSLWDNTEKSGITTISEYVMSKWHYGRIITVGDAAHTNNPIIGQGGNSAIESGAVLTNLLHGLLDGKPDGFAPTDEQIDEAFKQTTAIRYKRASATTALGRFLQSLYARETPKMELMNRVLMFLSKKETVFGRLGSGFKSAVRLEMLEIPAKPRLEPYYDERVTKPLKYTPHFLLLAAASVSLMVAASKTVPVPPTWSSWEALFELGRAVPETLSKLTTGFDWGSLKNLDVKASHIPQLDSSNWIYNSYSVLLSLPLYIFCAIESRRYSNKGLFLSWPFVFVALSSARGFSIGMPLYYLFHIYTNGGQDEFALFGVPEVVARSIQPLTQVAYATVGVPILTQVAQDSPLGDLAMSVWPLALVIVDMITSILARLQRSWDLRKDPKLVLGFDEYARRHTQHVFSAYRFAAGFGFMAYAGALTAAVYQLQFKSATSSAISEMAPTILSDLAFTLMATLLFMAYNIYELRRRGLVTTRQAWSALALSLPANVCMGPGAAVAALWWWRERVLVEISKKVEGGPVSEKVEPAK